MNNSPAFAEATRSRLLVLLFDERHNAVKRLIQPAIATAKQRDRKIGICGQAPSDYPEFAQFLVEQGIDSISLNLIQS